MALLDRMDAVLFDLDGTLLDTAPDLVNALYRVCDENGRTKPDFDLACRYVSTGAAGLIRLAFADDDEAQQENYRQRLVTLYADDLYAQTSPYPGIETVLKQLESNGLAWGVVTNKPANLTETTAGRPRTDRTVRVYR